jgi:hypothetical protein
MSARIAGSAQFLSGSKISNETQLFLELALLYTLYQEFDFHPQTEFTNERLVAFGTTIHKT